MTAYTITRTHNALHRIAKRAARLSLKRSTPRNDLAYERALKRRDELAFKYGREVERDYLEAIGRDK